MLLPQFSIRTLFALTAVAAMVAWVLSQAAYGARWAQCAGWMFVFAGCLFGLYSAMFLLTWSVGQMLGIVAPVYRPVASPFASGPVGPESQVPVNPFAPADPSSSNGSGPQP